jgi:hypothetical protein
VCTALLAALESVIMQQWLLQEKNQFAWPPAAPDGHHWSTNSKFSMSQKANIIIYEVLNVLNTFPQREINFIITLRSAWKSSWISCMHLH